MLKMCACQWKCWCMPQNAHMPQRTTFRSESISTFSYWFWDWTQVPRLVWQALFLLLSLLHSKFSLYGIVILSIYFSAPLLTYKNVWILLYISHKSLPMWLIRKRKVLKIKDKTRASENSVRFYSGVLEKWQEDQSTVAF